MPDLWFDQQAFIDAAREKGDDLRLCRRSVVTEAKPEYGMPRQLGWACRKLEGYVITKEFSQINVNTGSSGAAPEFARKTEQTAYVFPNHFSPNEVDGNTFFWFIGRLYQVDLVHVDVQRGKPILYQYKLKDTQETIDLATI